MPPPFLFTATAGEKKIDLTWKIPTHSVELNVQLISSEEGYPASATEGTVIYEGAGESISHKDLTDNQTYFYTLYCYLSIDSHYQGNSTKWYKNPNYF